MHSMIDDLLTKVVMRDIFASYARSFGYVDCNFTLLRCIYFLEYLFYINCFEI